MLSGNRFRAGVGDDLNPSPARYNRTMRRLGCWMFNGLAVMSLCLALVAAGLWVYTHMVVEQSFYPDLDVRMENHQGTVTFY
jgi:hypothetical protein